MTETARTEPVDDAVRKRIGSSGLSETLFVEAGAGSGKTTVLVDRIVNLIVEHGVEPHELAAITFTEAAASELRDRIRAGLERGVLDKGDVAVRCRAALADLDRSTITTLHGFALRILTEHAVAARLPPRVAVLDEVASQLQQERRWERFVDSLYDDADNETLLLRADVLDVPLEARYSNQATLGHVARIFTQSWDRLRPVADRALSPLPAVDFGAIDHAVADLESMASTCTDADDLLCVRIHERLAAMRELFSADELTRLSAFPRKATDSAWGPGRGGKGPNWGGDVGAAKAALRAVADAGVAIREAAADDVLARFVRLLARDVLGAADERRRDGQLEFHDLLVLARELLRTSPSARGVLGQRYRCLLLDEFQDTDPLQIELATLIAGELSASSDGAPVPSWDQVHVPQGRLFFVGDWKQSIYRFRRADVDLFLAASARFGDGDRGLSLTSNFRTVAPILDFVNGLFAPERMADAAEGDAAPTYEALDAVRLAPSDFHRPVVFGSPSGSAAGERRASEAADVVRVLHDIGRHPERWQVFDTERKEWRDPRLADVTVLLPARTSLPYLRAALDGAGIVYRLDTGSLVFATQEVADVLATVRAIADSSDSISLVTALRSTLYACSDVDLFTYRQAGGRWEVAAPRPSGLDADHPVVVALDHMRSLWKERWWIGPGALIERIVTERRAMLAALGGQRPRDTWRRLRFLVDQARAFEDAGQRGLREFVEWAELQRSDGARIHEPMLPETDDDAVRVMTIHGAKGLEFPITIVSGLTTEKGTIRRHVSVLWDADVPHVYLNSGSRTEGFDRRADIEDEMDGHERLRLLYVALTRARDHLAVSGHHKTGAGSHGELVWAYAELDPDRCRRLDDLDDVAELDRVDEVDDEQPRPRFDAAAAASARDEWLDRRRRLVSAGARPSVLSATGVASLGDRLPGGDVVTDEDLGPDDEPAPIALDGDDDNGSGADGVEPVRRRRQGRAGTAIGRAVHATLQSLDLATIDPDSPVVDRIAAREAELEAVVEAASQVAGGARSALTSGAVALARRHPHHKEMFVAAPVGASAVEGYIDLLIETPEGLVIIDYKTDTVRNDADVDAKLAHYSLQGATYAVALEAVTGLPVVDCRFVFCRASGAIERSVDDLPSVMDEVRARLATV